MDREGEGHGSDGTQQTLLLSLLLHHMFVISDDTDAGAAADKYRYRPQRKSNLIFSMVQAGS